MANHFEKESLEHSPGLSGTWCAHEEHRERIQYELGEFLSPQEARETAIQVYNLALDIDEDIDRILKDPFVGRL